MTFLDELGLRAAEQLETSVGAYVALASYKRLALAEPPIRGKATLGALRCAIELADGVEIQALLPRWAEERSLDVDASGLCARLLRMGRTRLAAELAEVEFERRPTPLVAYVAARIEDARGSTRALEAWDRAIDLAKLRGDDRVLAASVARWLELVLFSSSPPPLTGRVRDAIAERARIVPIEATTPAERLLIARARLLSPSKFQRASALSMLVDLAKTGVDTVRRNAILVAASHADSSGGRLEPVEADRVRAALSQWPEEAERGAALARLDTLAAIDALRAAPVEPRGAFDALVDRIEKEAPEASEQVERVRSLVRGGAGAGARTTHLVALEVRLFSLGVDAISAMLQRPGRSASFADAATAISRAREMLPPVAVVPPVLHSASLVGLTKPDAALRRASAAFLARSLERSFSVPTSGFLPSALALVRAGFLREGHAVLAEARRLKEPHATSYLAEVERLLAYEAFRRGDRKAALAGLRAARDLFDEVIAFSERPS